MNGIGAGHHQPQDGVSALVVCHPLLVRFAQDDGAFGPEHDLLERVYEILVVALSCWRRAASRAASFTRFLMSAPETPQPPLAPAMSRPFRARLPEAHPSEQCRRDGCTSPGF